MHPKTIKRRKEKYVRKVSIVNNNDKKKLKIRKHFLIKPISSGIVKVYGMVSHIFLYLYKSISRKAFSYIDNSNK